MSENDGSEHQFNGLPLYLVFLFSYPLITALNSLVHLVKTTYFTTLYISLSSPNEREPELGDKVDSFINFNDRTGNYHFFEELQNNEGMGQSEQDKVIMNISRVIKKNVDKGSQHKAVAKSLIIKEALKMVRRGLL